MLLNTAIIGKFNKLSVICKPGSIHGCKSNFILTLLLKGALALYQIYQVQSQKPDFWGYTIIK